MKAYILIKTVPGKDRSVLKALRKIKAISSVDVVTGPYNAVAIIEAPDSDTILDIVLDKVRYVEGIIDTVTCFAVRAN